MIAGNRMYLCVVCNVPLHTSPFTLREWKRGILCKSLWCWKGKLHRCLFQWASHSHTHCCPSPELSVTLKNTHTHTLSHHTHAPHTHTTHTHTHKHTHTPTSHTHTHSTYQHRAVIAQHKHVFLLKCNGVKQAGYTLGGLTWWRTSPPE